MATKLLAKRLGIIRKRSCKSGIDRQKRDVQCFKYLIVIDFESTCWKEKNFKPQEIIEFPAVLLNCVNGQILSEFHHYVMPQENGTLSDFCKELTGIKQEEVDQGMPLRYCLSRFSSWLSKVAKEHKITYNMPGSDGARCTFVTWSDWDLGVCLLSEVRRKQLIRPTELNSWIDLRATYRRFYNRKPRGLNGALEDLGITFEGREHSGIVDARNTAKLAHRMMQDGCVLAITKTITDNRTVNVAMQQKAWISKKISSIDNSKGCCPNLENALPENVVKMSDMKEKKDGIPSGVRSDVSTFVAIACTSTSSSVKSRSTSAVTSSSSVSKAKIQLPEATSTPKNPRQLTLTDSCDKPVFKVPTPPMCISKAESTESSPASSGKGSPSDIISKTPTPPGQLRLTTCLSSSSRAWTPNMTSFLVGSTHKQTPPLCQCGRRAVRKVVQNLGPNQGRAFYGCATRKRISSSSGNVKNCKFFKWESLTHTESSFIFNSSRKSSFNNGSYIISPLSK